MAWEFRMIRKSVNAIRSRFQRAHLRTQLLFTVNLFVAAILAAYLYIDFQQSVRFDLQEKTVSLSDESRTIHAAIQELRTMGPDAVQRHINTICATMNSGESPGHTIEVVIDGVHFISDATQHLHDHSSPWSELVAGSVSAEGVMVRVGERRKPLVAKVRRDSLEGLGVLVGSTLLGALVLNILLFRLVTRPLERTVVAVRAVGKGKHGITVGVRANYELSQLADEVSQMSQELDRRDSDRNAQLDRAQRLQAHLIPKKYLKVGLEVAIEFHPADEIAGDYVDVLECPNGDTLFCVADVVGHGIHAAMGSAVLKALLLTVDLGESSPSEMLRWINQRFCSASLPEDFASMILVRVSCDRRTMVYANAGHELGYLRNTDGEIQELNSTGTVLGIANDAEYENIEHQLHQGDLIALLSDGVSETHNSEKAMLGRGRISSIIQSPIGIGSDAVADEIVTRAVEHRGETQVMDDITVLVISVVHQDHIDEAGVESSGFENKPNNPLIDISMTSSS